MSGKLTQEQKREIAAWVEKHGGTLPCESCGKNAFHLADHLVAPPIIDASSKLKLGGTAYPFAIVICDNCANTRFYNIPIMKLDIFENNEKGGEDVKPSK